ncbi:MAG: hypothetical protein HQM04_06475 [Magnetococcales bacterium]|nr:hypothetical protein [Magnetococcales bacterium]MBF0114672.1 hypothetical protein [Magnetococcales bacterium]
MTSEEATDRLIPVPFRDDQLYLVDHSGEPYVPMRPVVEGMGLAWKPQYLKITQTTRFCVTMMVTPSEGGVQQTLCIPLRKLAGWLMTINPKKVAPEIKDKVIAYQNECDDALYDYWTKGKAVNPRSRTEKASFPERDPEQLTSIVDNLYFRHDMKDVPRFLEGPNGEHISVGESLGLNGLLEIDVPHFDSRRLAEAFNRLHYVVMRRIRNLPIPATLHAKLFSFRIEECMCGRDQPYFEVSREGFAILTATWRRPEDAALKELVLQVFAQEEAREVQFRTRQKLRDALRKVLVVQRPVTNGKPNLQVVDGGLA